MDGADRGTTAQAHVVGGPSPALTDESLAKLRTYGLLKLGDRLGENAENEYEEILRIAVRWYAKGEREEFLLDARLSYVTSVDLFFARDDGGSSTHRFCKGFAFALADRPEDIIRLARFARGIYASRSDTSHSGAFDYAHHDGFDDFRVASLQFLASMAGLPFESEVEIDEWLMARDALLDDDQQQLLKEAIETKTFKQDVALDWAIAILASDRGQPWGSASEHLRFVFWRLLVDSRRAREFHLQLRPYAQALLDAVSATDDADTRVVKARELLGVLPWLEESLSSRLGSDFA